MTVLPSDVPAIGRSATMVLDVSVVLRRYGFLGLNGDGTPATDRLDVRCLEPGTRISIDAPSLLVADTVGVELPGLTSRAEVARGFLYDTTRSWFRRRRPQYRALCPHVSFSGAGLAPIWITSDGAAVVAWWTYGGRRHLLVGLDIVQEMVRYTQGDPSKVDTVKDKSLWGFGHERPLYLYEDNVVAGEETVPWADRLGFLLVDRLSTAANLPRLSPLPGGAAGAILLTGDDDQAELTKYAVQQQLLAGFPITYLMLPHTRHTPETLATLSSSVEFGVHIDALDRPEDYDAICDEQTEAVRQLVGRPARTIRNHGHLNRGYWTHLAAWERNGLTLDFQIRGVDGTCPTGSYLPFRTRRPDGSWSAHWSLFSTFSDGMFFVQKWSEEQQIACISALAKRIAASFPGIIVANFHPQNVESIPNVHRAVMRLGRQPGWIALGGESYAAWLQAREDVEVIGDRRGLRLVSANPIDKLALIWPGSEAPVVLPEWRGEQSVAHSSVPS